MKAIKIILKTVLLISLTIHIAEKSLGKRIALFRVT